MNKILSLFLISIFLCGTFRPALAAEPIPLNNSEIEKCNDCIKKSQYKYMICVGGKKIEAPDGTLYLAKCRADGGIYFLVGISAQPGKEWEIKQVISVTDKD